MVHVCWHARSLLLLMAVATWGCGEPKERGATPPCEGKCKTYSGGSAVLAGTVGTCIPFSPLPGYRTCLMSKPQNANEPASGAKTSALKLPPPAITYNTLPTTVDHRTYLKSCIEVHSQGQCGWCTAHSTTAALEAMLCKDKQTYRRISEPHLWWLGKERGEFKQCKGGWHISSAFTNLGAMTDQGYLLVRGPIWPYSPDLEQMNKAKPTNADLKLYGQYGASNGKIFSVPSKSLISLKTALASGYNVVYSVPTFKDTGWKYWDDDYGAIVAPSPAPKNKCKCKDCPKEKHCLTGHHAILIVGYDDADGGWFYILNSWGKWWADGGFGKIAYDVISKYGNGGRYATAVKTKHHPGQRPLQATGAHTVYGPKRGE